MKIRTVQADPSGNITLFVLDPVPLEQRRDINEKLLSGDTALEQVGCLSLVDGQPKVEMMGGEFCGNATRSAGAYALHTLGKKEGDFQVTCSGCSTPLPVHAKKSAGKLLPGQCGIAPAPFHFQTAPFL
jgi:histidine racemase